MAHSSTFQPAFNFNKAWHMARLIGVCLIIVPITFSSVAAADNSNYNTDTLTDAELMSSTIEIDNVVDSSAMTYQTSFDDDLTASELDAIDAVPAKDEFSEITDDYDNDEAYDDLATSMIM